MLERSVNELVWGPCLTEEYEMAKYLFVYHGGSMPESEEEGAKVMEAWGLWEVI